VRPSTGLGAGPSTGLGARRGWLVGLTLLSGCVDTLPDQDLRIRVTPIVAKMPAEFLWKEYQADAREADRKYRGKAIEISGKATQSDSQDTGGPSKSYLLFKQSDTVGVRANLLDEDAADILKTAAAGGRLRLKCFCAGLDGHVILKSCVKG
jgi:hypothetical protein